VVVSIWQLEAGQHKKKYDLVFHRTRNWCPTVISRTVFYTATMETVDLGNYKSELACNISSILLFFGNKNIPIRTGTHTSADSRVLSEQSIYKSVLLCQEQWTRLSTDNCRFALQCATCSETKANSDVNYKLYTSYTNARSAL
jgi:hypothetical protein